MITKTPKSKFIKYIKRGAIAAFVVEAFSFAGCYAVYYKLNTERDFRLYIRDNYPPILDLYYKTGEYLGNSNLRQRDNDIWYLTQQSEK